MTTPSSLPCFVVEKLDAVSLLPSMVVALRSGGGYYLHVAGWMSNRVVQRWLRWAFGLRKCHFTDFPGSYFEAHSLSANHANEMLWEAVFSREAKPIIALLKRANRHPLMMVALKRAILEKYTFLRVKTYILLREISRHKGSVLFWPQDKRDMLEFIPKSLESNIIQPIIQRGKWMCGVRELTDRGGVIIYLFVALAYLIVRRPLCLKDPKAHFWRVGFDILNSGIHWDFPHHDDLFFNDKDLSPNKILHVVRNKLQDEKTRLYFVNQGIPFVEATRLHLPLGYLFCRVVGVFMVGMLGATWRTLGAPLALPFLKEGARLLMSVLVRAEILDTQFPTDVFVGRDEYGVAHIIRTMLHDERGGRTLGFTHGDILSPEVTNSYLACHVFCVAGDFEKELLAKHTAHCQQVSVIGAGVYGLDFSFQCRRRPLPKKHPYNALKRRGRLVGVFGGNAYEDGYISEAMRRRFYDRTIEVLKPFQDVVAVLRPKGGGGEDLSWPRSVAIKNERVIVDDPTWTYEALPWFDLVICLSLSTVGIEAMMAGVPVFFFDETGLADHPYERCSPLLVARTPEALYQRVNEFLRNGRYVDKAVIESIRQKHGGWFDGKTRDRLRSEVYRLISETTHLTAHA